MRNIKKILISLVIPCHNEQKAIMPFILETEKLAAQHQLHFEYLFVNDGSHDKTLEALQSAQEQFKGINIIDFTRNFGKEAALTAGLQHARGDVIIPIDVDGEDPPDVIVDMLEKWQGGANHIIAIRECRKNDPLIKRITAQIFYKVFNSMSDLKIPHNGGDLRLLDRTIVEYIKQLGESNRFMKGIFSWAGFPDAEVHYKRQVRSAGKPSYTTKKLLILALNGIFCFSSWPLRVWGVIGVSISGLSGLYGLTIVAKSLIYGRQTPGYASLMVTILFLGGIQLISLSILGEYISRIFLEVKKRPLYLIKTIHLSGKNSDK